MMLQQHVFPPLSFMFLCFDGLDANGQGVYRADQSVWSGFNCRWTRVDDKGRISEIMEDSKFSCEPGTALCTAPCGLVLGTMVLRANRVCIDQNDMFNCVIMTSITTVTLVTRGAATQVAVPFVLDVDQAAYLYITAMRNDMKAPQVRRVLLTELSCQEQRVVLVASLAALLRRMHDVANGNRVRVLLLGIGEKKVESSRRTKGSSSVTHSAPYDRSDEHSSNEQSQKMVRFEGPNDPANAAGVAEGCTHAAIKTSHHITLLETTVSALPAAVPTRLQGHERRFCQGLCEGDKATSPS
jgi:hypothetical protein